MKRTSKYDAPLEPYRRHLHSALLSPPRQTVHKAFELVYLGERSDPVDAFGPFVENDVPRTTKASGPFYTMIDQDRSILVTADEPFTYQEYLDYVADEEAEVEAA